MRATARTVKEVVAVRKGEPTTEGAGVRLVRAFGPEEAERLDPFLLLDHFGSDDPEDYTAGFPFHPHRGMETVTYMIRGIMDHADSLGNKGTIGPGDVQWMTAGSGIIHQEMPRRSEGGLEGFQLWVNLPADSKMMSPRYRDVRMEDIPTLAPSEGVMVKVIAGEMREVRGPIRDLIAEVMYLDASMDPGARLEAPVPEGWNAFLYVYRGYVHSAEGGQLVGTETAALLGDGDAVAVEAGEDGARLLLVAGRPIEEPVSSRGPVVMNTEEELREAFREIREGTFVKDRPRT